MERAVLESAPSIGGPEEYADFVAREVIEAGIGLVPPYVQQEVADLILGLESSLIRGDVAEIRAMFAPDAVVVLDGARGLDQLARFYAEGGRMEVDIQRLDTVRPEGRGIVARFVANVSVLGERSPVPGRPGRLQVTLAEPRDPERRTTPGPWVISGLSYQAGG